MIDDPNRPTSIEAPETIDTDRLTLRAPRVEDAMEIDAAIAESLAELSPWMAWAQTPLLPGEQKEVLRGAVERFTQRISFQYLIFLKGTHTIIGSSGFHSIDWSVPSMEIGYWVRTPFAGQGYVTEAVITLRDLAFNQLGARRVVIVCECGNTRSAAVARRAGFELEGVFRCNSRNPHTGKLVDDMVFALVRPEN